MVKSRVIKKIGHFQIHAERKAHGVKLKARLSCLTALYHVRFRACRQGAVPGAKYGMIFTLFAFKTRDLYLRLKHGISRKKRPDWGKQGGDTSMDVFTAINQRRSVRAYKAAEVEEEKLKKILEAARLSPSASNRQDWKFIVVRNKETRKKLAKAAFGQSFIG